jgi:molecular chaperone DnaJ
MNRGFLGNFVTLIDCARCEGGGQIPQTPCKQCNGKRRVRRVRKFTVDIPAGANTGTSVRYTGQGSAGDLGASYGDLFVMITVEDHPIFQRRNHDILVNLNINVAQAALGAVVTVPTVEGDEKISIEPGTQTGKVITLPGKGVPRLRTDGRTEGRGDQLILVSVSVPTKLSAEQRHLFEELGRSLGTETIQQNNTGSKGFFERMANFFTGE